MTRKEYIELLKCQIKERFPILAEEEELKADIKKAKQEYDQFLSGIELSEFYDQHALYSEENTKLIEANMKLEDWYRKKI